MRAFVALLALLVSSCADDEDEAPLYARFTSRPAIIQVSSDVPDECVYAVNQDVLFYRTYATLAAVMVDPGAPSVNGIPVRGVIGIYVGTPQKPDSLAETKRSYTVGGDIFSAEIVLRMGAPLSCDALAIAHELGHALGLEHTDIRDNVMNRYLELGGWSLTESQLEWIAD